MSTLNEPSTFTRGSDLGKVSVKRLWVRSIHPPAAYQLVGDGRRRCRPIGLSDNCGPRSLCSRTPPPRPSASRAPTAWGSHQTPAVCGAAADRAGEARVSIAQGRREDMGAVADQFAPRKSCGLPTGPLQPAERGDQRPDAIMAASQTVPATTGSRRCPRRRAAWMVTRPWAKVSPHRGQGRHHALIHSRSQPRTAPRRPRQQPAVTSSSGVLARIPERIRDFPLRSRAHDNGNGRFLRANSDPVRLTPPTVMIPQNACAGSVCTGFVWPGVGCPVTP